MLNTRWLAVFSLFLAACSAAATSRPMPTTTVRENDSESPVGRVHKSGQDKVIAMVGRSGGTLMLANGARLDIPDGALSENTEITFAEGGKTTAFANRENERAIGPTLEVSPALSPAKAFEVSLPLAQVPEEFSEADLTLAAEVRSDRQRAVEMTGVQTHWDYLPASLVRGRLEGELRDVPGMRVQFIVSRGN